jgi:hypothetical protein
LLRADVDGDKVPVEMKDEYVEDKFAVGAEPLYFGTEDRGAFIVRDNNHVVVAPSCASGALIDTVPFVSPRAIAHGECVQFSAGGRAFVFINKGKNKAPKKSVFDDANVEPVSGSRQPGFQNLVIEGFGASSVQRIDDFFVIGRNSKSGGVLAIYVPATNTIVPCSLTEALFMDNKKQILAPTIVSDNIKVFNKKEETIFGLANAAVAERENELVSSSSSNNKKRERDVRALLDKWGTAEVAETLVSAVGASIPNSDYDSEYTPGILRVYDSGRGAYYSVPKDTQDIVFGSAADVDVRINEDKIAPRHFHLNFNWETKTTTLNTYDDNDNTHTVFVNGIPIVGKQSVGLPTHSTLQLGHQSFYVLWCYPKEYVPTPLRKREKK